MGKIKNSRHVYVTGVKIFRFGTKTPMAFLLYREILKLSRLYPIPLSNIIMGRSRRSFYIFCYLRSPLASFFEHQQEQLPERELPLYDERELPHERIDEEQEVMEDIVPRVTITVIFLYPFP